MTETALGQELAGHLGHEKNTLPGKEAGNVRNGSRPKTVLAEGTGQVGTEVPRDRDGTFGRQVVKKRQRRLSGVDEIVLPLYARGLTTGEVSAHFAEVYGASVAEETVSRITGRVAEEVQAWAARPLDEACAAVLIDIDPWQAWGRRVGPAFPGAADRNGTATASRAEAAAAAACGPRERLHPAAAVNTIFH